MEQFNVMGMSCAACSARVEKAVTALEGVEDCAVSLLTNSMSVSGTATPEEIIKAVEKAGYGASLKSGKKKEPEQSHAKDKETPILIARLVSSVIFLIVLMYFSMGHAMWGFPLPHGLAENVMAQGLVQLLLTVVIMVINQHFFISGFTALARRAPNMDTLVALGSSAAFIYSTFELFRMSERMLNGDAMGAHHALHGLYFESAAMILTLITVGKMLEAHSKGKTTAALESLMRLAPKTAKVIRDGNELEIPAEQVVIGDIFAVYPGDSIPADGIVIEGVSAVNESALTGESVPTDKSEGSTVSAGTVNTSGFMKCRATRIGEDTTLSQIIKTVSDAAATKAPIAKVADKVSGIFVPTVIAIACLTAAVWLLIGKDFGFALARAISVLVISCPCALGLATPVAIMVGNGVGARNGILFKTAVSLEETGRARIALLDKTGTITVGKPEVTAILPADGFDEDELLFLAASLEAKSEHPLAAAIVTSAKEKEIKTEEVSDFMTLTGSGLFAKLCGKELCGGNLKYISEKTDISPDMREKADELAMQGKTPMFFTYSGRVAGMIAVADKIREDSAEAVSELKAMGMYVVMLTGDNERTANAVGRAAGVDEVVAGVLPSGKEAAVRKYSESGKVVMVGDGINDAPALTRADVGIAIGAGTDVAIDAADVVLVKSRLRDLPAALRLSRATLRNIHQNLFWAFVYNAVGIPLAAGVFIPLGIELDPMFGAAAMSLSSFCVVTNALRLNFFKLYDGRKFRAKQKNIKSKEKKKMEKTLNVEGMMCSHCEAHVKKALEALEGVESAIASHEKKTVVVTLVGNVSDETLKKAIEDEGYKVI